MITVKLNKRDFEYDIHSLVRAFYPGVDVPLYLEGETQPEGFEKQLEVFYGEDGIRLIWRDADGAVLAQKERAVDDYEDRTATKNTLKALLYELLSEYTGQKLPWGNLTGIRPTKIPMGLLEQGWKNTEIADYMRKTYYTSNEKTALAISIANRERAILKDIDYQNGYSLYVGIPFCPSICLYCSFGSSPLSVWKNRVDDYLDALCREIEQTAHIWQGKTLDTVYIGGGTPTTLSPEQMQRLLEKLEECFDFSHLKEFTVEAGRPDSITAEKLQVLKKHPVTRISINPQTMNDGTLEVIGRGHTAAQTKEAFAMARQLGFDNINMDLIVGLPGEGYPEVEYTMQQVTALAPDSITVHSLALKRATRLNLFKDKYAPVSFVNSGEIMDMTARYAAQAGQFPYYLYRQKNMAGNFENVGYAREGAAGIYNILIMEEKQSILALGAGASTKIVSGGRIERIENVKDIRSYIERIDEMIARKSKIMG
ncbi:coproporphyrinogen dehydrogenase HemZ [Marvinbryantia formatexigens DSM 14469]|uniref:Coproporphyrinogen dehydrogenase HemZ n=1 Tax=Marvinbryantia formatexigens DSM 14469 TaxID=478749 RepID=C6LBY7_9FIRM|nr:coproporphyrinogen dehydrogenase HemZ [Marvinbryantia formatexigens]EET61940.1 coproporphyrinogen dehydrogenase HemZ [Marvinbryantia formatexigens DSM 14469]UWO25721.1 coproporphyrinogen dehydrogenase HemZ [Marvinbryantia formatexigens DSM 14469]SDF34262.1 oxygen-independent coproporphyrinogen-3 oxidase [Marvinbryantia formatexigens]